MIDSLIESDGILASEQLLRQECQPDGFPDKLLDRANEIGWLAALQEAYSPEFVEYVTNKGRLSFIDLLPIEPTSHVIEIGPGFGQMTVEIARRSAKVTAVEADIKQARFCRIRLDQENRRNVRIIAGGESGSLPIDSSSVDGVVMNLVLEWCAIRSDRREHENFQRKYLSEIARCLKPGGFFFVSTKNRFSTRLVLGGKDEHMSDLRFGSALPRPLSRLLRKHEPPGGQLHSYPKLTRMLADSGFVEIKGLLAFPDMRWPAAYWPAEDGLKDSAAALAMSSLPLKQRLLLGAVPRWLVKYLAPGLTFLARKGATG